MMGQGLLRCWIIEESIGICMLRYITGRNMLRPSAPWPSVHLPPGQTLYTLSR